jgi:glycosyltransferase involved in cell wall biosynthesis
MMSSRDGLRYYVDLQPTQIPTSRDRGIGRYTLELVAALIRAGAPIDTLALSPLLPFPARLPQEIISSPALRWSTAKTFEEARERGPLAYFVASPMEFDLAGPVMFPSCAIEGADAIVAVFYDLIPYLFRDRYLVDPHLRARYLSRLEVVREMDLLLAISEHTRRDTIEHLGIEPDRCATIGGGVSEWFKRPAPDEDPLRLVRRALPSIDRPFILSVTGWEWRKNTELLIRSYGHLPAELRAHFQLVVACHAPADGAAAWRAEAAAAGVDDDQMVLTGFVDDEVLRALYQSTALFVFPSKYEGYGLPVAEAARCGAPVITADNSSLPEILSMPESTFPSDDPDALASLMIRALTDEDFRGDLLSASERAATVHTWDNVAHRTIEAMNGLERRLRPRRPRSRRKRVGIVGPFAPAPSGVAIYNSRIVEAMAENMPFDLHLFAEETAVGAWPAPADVIVQPVEALGTAVDPYDYDLLVYTIGTSVFHIETYERARQYPGLTWLHDANLVGLHLERAKRLVAMGLAGNVEEVMRHEVRSMYGRRAPNRILGADVASHAAYLEQGLLLTVDIVRRSRGIIVNSSAALRMIELDMGAEVLPASVVLNHAVPTTHDVPVKRASSRKTVVTLGIGDQKKLPELLIEAVAAVGDIDLLFVGQYGIGLRNHLTAHAASFGIADAMEFTGEVEFADYWAAIDRADCAVQLRRISFGESSGAVHDAISRGVPVITNMPACADLPSDVVQLTSFQVGVAELSQALRSVLFDDERASAMRAAALDYASSWTFADVASRFTDVVKLLLDRVDGPRGWWR